MIEITLEQAYWFILQLRNKKEHIDWIKEIASKITTAERLDKALEKVEDGNDSGYVR